MKAKLMMQLENENMIIDNLIKDSEKKPKKAYFFMGNFKETGFEILENCLIDLKAKKLLVIGIDKKNTTKKMLEGLYKYTKNIFVYNNNNLVELDSNVIVFEYEKESVIYILSGNVSKGGLEDNLAIYTKLTFNLENKEDKKEYDEYIGELLKVTKMEILRKLDKEYINELLNSKEIFSSKLYTHNVMSIAELASGSKNETKHVRSADVNLENNSSIIVEQQIENIYDEDAKIKTISKIDLVDMSFDIDVGDVEVPNIAEEIKEIKKESTKDDAKKILEKETTKNIKRTKAKKEVKNDEILLINKYDDKDVEFDPNSILDLENILFEKSVVKLDIKKISEKEKKEKEKKKILDSEEKTSGNKKIDLNKVSNIVMEVAKKVTKGRDLTAIKIPNYIKDMVPNFFEIMDSSVAVNKKDGLYKEAKISLEIVDTLNNKKYTDVSAVLSSKVGQTYIAFMSDMMTNVDYDDGDIIRIIKLSGNVYHIEVISKASEEHRVWKKMCSQSFRGASRYYGIM